MRASNLFRFISHIMNMIAASGKKRIAYAFANIIIMALGVFFAIAIKWLAGNMGESIGMLFACGFGILICALLALLCFLQGFVAQIALVIIAGIGMFHPEERAGNVISFLIALLTTAGLIAALVIFLKMV